MSEEHASYFDHAKTRGTERLWRSWLQIWNLSQASVKARFTITFSQGSIIHKGPF